MKFLNKHKHEIFQIVFLLVLLSLTFYTLLKDQELDEIWASVSNSRPGWLILGIFFVIIFVCSESVIIHYMMRSLGKEAPLGHCIRYSFVGFFFSCITPSASGGQPMQIYYMSKEKLDISVSTLVLMIVTICYKAVLVFVGLGVILFCRPMIDQYMADTKFWLYLGVALNVGCVTLMSFLVFWPGLTRWILERGMTFLERLHLMKHKEARWAKLFYAMDKYKDASAYFWSHKLVVLNVTLISIFQRFCLFFVTYFVYRSLGLSGTGWFDIVMLQAMISVAVDMLPLPGGMGASEALFMSMFEKVFGPLTLSGLLVSRGISYYGLIIMSAVITIFTHIVVMHKWKREKLLQEEKR